MAVIILIGILASSITLWPLSVYGWPDCSTIYRCDSEKGPGERLLSGNIATKAATGVILEHHVVNVSAEPSFPAIVKWQLDSHILFSIRFEVNSCTIRSPNSSIECLSITESNLTSLWDVSLGFDTLSLSAGSYNITAIVPAVHVATWNIAVADCVDTVKIKVQHSGERATFNTGGNISCSREGARLVNTSASALVVSHNTFCNKDAIWDGLNDLDCWYAPKINISTRGNDSNFEHNKTASFRCTVIIGMPMNTTAQLCVGKEECSPTMNDTFDHNITMKAEYNGLNISCKASNEYFKLVNEDAAYSSFPPLNIHFGPYEPSCKVEHLESDMILLHVEFSANPPCAGLQFSGSGAGNRFVRNGSNTNRCCGVDRQYFDYNLSNDYINDRINITCNDSSARLVVYTNKNLSSCSVQSTTVPTSKGVTTTASTATGGGTQTNFPLSGVTTAPTATGGGTEPNSPLSEAAIAGIAGGAGVLLILCIALMGCLIWRRKKKSDSFSGTSQNPAFSESSAPDQQNSERQECSNVLYGTADDLKSGGTSGSNSKEVVDNVLYGSTAGPQLSNQVYASVNKTGKKSANDSEQAADLYSSVQKTKKSKTNGKGVDPGASTSNIQSADTYAEVDRGGKKKKDGKNARKGKQNAGFSDDLEQDVTYAAIDKKNRKGAKGKKSDDKPGTSGMVEEATYAEVKKPKKDGPDDEDLHGSNK